MVAYYVHIVSESSCFTYLYRRVQYYSEGNEGDINEVKKRQENRMKQKMKQKKEKNKGKDKDSSESEGEVNSGDESDEDKGKELNNEKANKDVKPSINPLIPCHCEQYMKPNAFDKDTLKEQKITFKCQFTEECKKKAEYLNDLCDHYYCKKCIKNAMHDRKKNEPIECPVDKKMITPIICLDVDVEKTLKIYGRCRLNSENCTYLPECINDCKCTYCRVCVEKSNIDCPCRTSNTRTGEVRKQIRNLMEK